MSLPFDPPSDFFEYSTAIRGGQTHFAQLADEVQPFYTFFPLKRKKILPQQSNGQDKSFSPSLQAPKHSET